MKRKCDIDIEMKGWNELCLHRVQSLERGRAERRSDIICNISDLKCGWDDVAITVSNAQSNKTYDTDFEGRMGLSILQMIRGSASRPYRPLADPSEAVYAKTTKATMKWTKWTRWKKITR